jgi:2-aminoethylphosphonate-pyruvate transaminase
VIANGLSQVTRQPASYSLKLQFDLAAPSRQNKTWRNINHMMQFKGPDGQEDMPYLLTPGPVTTSRNVKFAMLADWGARDAEFASLVQTNVTALKRLAGCDSSYECVILQGSATSGIEAALGTLSPSKRKKTLVVANGAYGQRAAQIMQRIGRNHVLLSKTELKPLNPEDVAKAVDGDRNISHVWVVHCETTTGLVNPLAEIAAVVKSRGRVLMVDAIASFGALPLDMTAENIDVLVASPNTCLEAVPGFSFVFAKRDLLMAAKGECHSLVLDLFEQWQELEATGLLRFTPPTHALVALRQALRELDDEGGIKGRLQRYRINADAFNTRMRALGFSMLLTSADAGPIVQTVLSPADRKFKFKVFYDKLKAKGFAIYPGKLTHIDSFRVSMIGQINEKLIIQLITAIESVMAEMDVRSFAPARD